MIRQAILKTLSYSDHFNFPLTLNELHTRLISIQISQTSLLNQIRQIINQGDIAQTDLYFHLPGRKNLAAQRKKRAQTSSLQLIRAGSLAHKLGRTPGVLAIYLTGSLAMQNSTPNSDIDFMVITQPHKLWTTRFLLTLVTSLLGLRRTPNSQSFAGQVCLNLYLTPNSYLLPKLKRTLYSAYELIQAVPLHDPHDTHSQLLATNSWIKNYLPNYNISKHHSPKLENRVTGILEYFFYHLQLLYMRRNLTREYITLDSAFFHPHDPSPKL